MQDSPGGAWRRRRSSVGSGAGSFHAGRSPVLADVPARGENGEAIVEPGSHRGLEALGQVFQLPMDEEASRNGSPAKEPSSDRSSRHGTSAVPFSTLAKGSQFTFESAPPGFDEMQGGGENMGGGWNLPDAIGGNRAAMVVASSGSEAQTDNRSSNIDMSSMFERPMVPSVDSDGRGGMSKEEFVQWKKMQAANARARMQQLDAKFRQLKAKGLLSGEEDQAESSGAEGTGRSIDKTYPPPQQRSARGRLYAGDSDATSRSEGARVMPKYHRPISKEDLREIVREEVKKSLDIKEQVQKLERLQLYSGQGHATVDGISRDNRAQPGEGMWKPAPPDKPGQQGTGFMRNADAQKAAQVAMMESMGNGGGRRGSMGTGTWLSTGTRTVLPGAVPSRETAPLGETDSWVGKEQSQVNANQFVSVSAGKSSPYAASPMVANGNSSAVSPIMSSLGRPVPEMAKRTRRNSVLEEKLLEEGETRAAGVSMLLGGTAFHGVEFGRTRSDEGALIKEQRYQEINAAAKSGWAKLRGMRGNMVALLYEASQKDRVIGDLSRGGSYGKGKSGEENNSLRDFGKRKNDAQKAIEKGARKFREMHMKEQKSLEECCERSLRVPFIFSGYSQQSLFRNWCFQLQTSSKWNFFFTCVTIMQCAYVAVQPDLVIPIDSPLYLKKKAALEGEILSEGGLRASINQRLINVVDYIDPFTMAVLAFEMFTGTVAYGAYKEPGSWIKSSRYNQMDVVVMIATIVEYIVTSLYDNIGLNLKPIRILRIFKSVTKISVFAGIKTIMITLGTGGTQFFAVLAMLLFSMCSWAIFGMAMYKRSHRRRCVTTEYLLDSCFSDYSTGWAPTCNMTDRNRTDFMWPGGDKVIFPGYPFESWCKIVRNTTAGQFNGKYATDKFGNYHNCAHTQYLKLIEQGEGHEVASQRVTQTCMEVGNPGNGFIHFDNIGGALLALADNSYYDVLWRSIQSEPESVGLTYLYYFCVICFNSFLLLGIFVAVVTGTFSRVRQAYGSAFLSHEESSMNRSRELTNMWVVSVGLIRKKMHKARLNNEKVELEVDHVQEITWHIQNNKWFRHFYSLVCIFHGVAMAADQYDAPGDIREFVTYGYIIFNLLFLVECWVIFASSGSFTKYFEKHKNKFEMTMVISGVLGLITNSKILLLAPAVRLYRLMRYLPTLEALLISALSSVKAIFNLGVFVVIIAMCVTVVGRYIFRSDMDALTRSNYGSFATGLITTFQILTGDEWGVVLISSASTKSTLYGELLSTLFIIGWYVFSALIIFNLFVAVIIENFQVKETMDNIMRPGNVSKFTSTFRGAFTVFFRQSVNARARETGIAGGVSEAGLDHGELQAGKEATVDVETVGDDVDAMYGFLTDEVNFKSDIALVLRTAVVSRAHRIAVARVKPPERVLFLFGPNNLVRQLFVFILHQTWFDLAVYGAITGSVVFLMITPPAIDIPDDPPVLAVDMMNSANSLFTFIFTVEFFSRIMANGFYYTENAYLKDWWNVADFVVLFFAWVDEANLIDNSKVAKVIRLSRAFRPLRLMKRNVNMRLVIDALIRTLPPVAYVIAFSIVTFFVFALIGMGLIGGMMASCYPSDPMTQYPYGKNECYGTFVLDSGWQNGVLKQRSWLVDFYNFDTFYMAGLTLFRVNTLKYVGLMYRARDTTGIGQSPSQDARPEMAGFFIIYIVIGALFVMNLFVGFIIDGFNANRGTTPVDVNYARFYRQILAYRPVYPRYKTPMNLISVGARRIVSDPMFARFSSLCVAVNIAFMLTDSADADGYHEFILDTQNNVFFGELCLEVLINLVAYGPGGFIDDPWKGFDLVVCLATAIGPILGSRYANFAKSFRLLRIVVLMNQIKPIRVILETLIACLPALSNILILLFLVYSIFAVVAVQLFGTTKYGWRFGPTANFNSYANSLLTVMQIVTGDEWNDIMADVSVEPPFCTAIFAEGPQSPGYSNWRFGDLSFGDCGTSIAPVYFILLKLVCENIMLNLFIGMILDNFSFITEDSGDPEDAAVSSTWDKGSPAEVVQAMSKIFSMFDGRTGNISVASLTGLMLALPAPMGFRGPDGKVHFKCKERAELRVIRAELNVILRQGQLDEEALNDNEELWLKKLWRKLTSPGTSFVNSVTYVQFMLTVLHWRLPTMVPVSVQIGRADRVEEVGLMTYAIVCMEFFRSVHGRRKHKRVLRAIRDRVEFRQWSLRDLPRRRRSLTNREFREKEHMLVEKLRRDVRYLKIEPDKTLNIELSPAGNSIGLIEPHDKALYKVKRKFPKPMDGLGVFLERAERDLVVLRYVDDKSKKQDVVVADFTEIKWEGWEQQDRKEDSVLFPVMVDPSPEFADRWVKIDFVVGAFVAQAKHRFVGSCLDIQSFNTDRGEREAAILESGEDIVQSIPRRALRFNQEANVVRLNIGTYRWHTVWPDDETHEEGEKRRKMGIPEPVRLPKSYDCVMEVAGYIEHKHAHAIMRGATKTSKVSETARRDLTEILEDENTVAEHVVRSSLKQKLRNLGNIVTASISGSSREASKANSPAVSHRGPASSSVMSSPAYGGKGSKMLYFSDAEYGSPELPARTRIGREGGGGRMIEMEQEDDDMSTSGDEGEGEGEGAKERANPEEDRTVLSRLPQRANPEEGGGELRGGSLRQQGSLREQHEGTTNPSVVEGKAAGLRRSLKDAVGQEDQEVVVDLIASPMLQARNAVAPLAAMTRQDSLSHLTLQAAAPSMEMPRTESKRMIKSGDPFDDSDSEPDEGVIEVEPPQRTASDDSVVAARRSKSEGAQMLEGAFARVGSNGTTASNVSGEGEEEGKEEEEKDGWTKKKARVPRKRDPAEMLRAKKMPMRAIAKDFDVKKPAI